MSVMKRLAESRSVRRNAFPNTWEGPFEIEIQEDGQNQQNPSVRTPEEIEAFNSRIMAWSEKVKSALVPSIRSQSISGTRLSRSIRNTFQKDYGEISRLGFSFARHGIFVHKGVGRGYQAQGGVVVKTSKTPGFNRKPKPWFNPVVESHLDELGHIIHDHNEKAIINATRIFIR